MDFCPSVIDTILPFFVEPLFLLDSDTTSICHLERRMNVNLCNGVLTKNWVIPRIVMGDIYGYLSSRTIALPRPIMIAPYVAFHDYFFSKDIYRAMEIKSFQYQDFTF